MKARHAVKPKNAIFGDGYRKLEDLDVFEPGDETACASTLLAGDDQWGRFDDDTEAEFVGKTIGFVCDETGDMDGGERLFRRRAVRASTSAPPEKP